MPTTRTLPTGTLTFLFSDIEGSTRLVTVLGQGFGAVLGRHHAILRAAFEADGGIEVSTEGDAFFVVFRSAPAAVEAAANAQRALASEPWPEDAGTVRVRMGIHTGEGTLGGDDKSIELGRQEARQRAMALASFEGGLMPAELFALTT